MDKVFFWKNCEAVLLRYSAWFQEIDYVVANTYSKTTTNVFKQNQEKILVFCLPHCIFMINLVLTKISSKESPRLCFLVTKQD